MFGNGGLGDPKRGLDLTNAHHSLLKHLQKLHPVGIGQRLHDLDEFLHGISLILLIWNIVTVADLVKTIFPDLHSPCFDIIQNHDILCPNIDIGGSFRHFGKGCHDKK